MRAHTRTHARLTVRDPAHARLGQISTQQISTRTRVVIRAAFTPASMDDSRQKEVPTHRVLPLSLSLSLSRARTHTDTQLTTLHYTALHTYPLTHSRTHPTHARFARPHTHTHLHLHARTHARTHARARAHTHGQHALRRPPPPPSGLIAAPDAPHAADSEKAAATATPPPSGKPERDSDKRDSDRYDAAQRKAPRRRAEPAPRA